MKDQHQHCIECGGPVIGGEVGAVSKLISTNKVEFAHANCLLQKDSWYLWLAGKAY